jgi:hypothetical protein
MWGRNTLFNVKYQEVHCLVIVIIVLKTGPVIDSARVLGHWVIGRTTESLVEPHDRIGLNRMTRRYDSVFIKKILCIELD